MGKQGINPMWIIAIAAVVLVGIVGYSQLGAKPAPLSIGGGTTGGNQTSTGGTITVLGTTQTLSVASYDADKPGTGVSSSYTYYLNPSTGALSPGGNVTNPGTTYTVMGNVTGYFADIGSVTTGNLPSPSLTLTQKAVDTAVSLSVYNTNGVTANTEAANLTIGSAGSGTAQIQTAQSAAYKHLSGKSNKFAVYVNATNVTDWNPAQMSIVWDNTACTALGQSGLSNVATPSALKQVLVYAAVCNGDFLPNDGSPHKLSVKFVAASGTNPVDQDASVCLAGVDYYQDTTNGAVGEGAVKDSGAAIQTLQCATVNIG